MLTAKNKKFYLNGEEFKIQSGSMHYFRLLPEYWENVLTKIKAAGLNTVETYTCWNLHEPHKGQFDFSGMLDLPRFLETAQRVGLKVILRTGPFICAEWENGGLPPWLLKKEYNIKLRCFSEPYMTHLKDWFHVLLGKIRPYLESNGGPIILMAVENEYGSFGDDFNYLKAVEQIYIDEKIDCLFMSSDGNKDYHLSTGRSGTHIVQGIDHGGIGSIDSFKLTDALQPDAPRFSVEYWAGGFTNWRMEKCGRLPDEYVKKTVNNYVDIGASFNFYMFFGGTNFGFMNGAQGDLSWFDWSYNPTITSYDYDAAISEWCGYTPRYFDVLEAMERDHGKSDTPLPPSPELQNIGKVEFTQSAELFGSPIGKNHKTVAIESMEEFDQNYGYILYSKTFDYDSHQNILKISGIRDRAHVFLNKEFVATRMRGEDESEIFLPDYVKKGDTIDILIENMGRINYGEDTFFGDRKGIIGGVFLTHFYNNQIRNPGKLAFNWNVTCLEMDDLEKLEFKNTVNKKYPSFFRGTFKAEKGRSCFVHYDNLKKGFIVINGFNIGRYWERGPLTALYVPGSILKEENEIIIFETDGVKGELSVEITDVCGIQNHAPDIKV